MKTYLKSLLLVFVLTSHCFAMDVITSEHGERLDKFTANRQDGRVLTHTNAIYGVLNDENKISNRQATDAEKKTIFQSLMASEIIHGGIETAGQGSIAPFAHTIVNQAYKDHYRIIDLVGQLSRGLIDQFKAAGYEGVNVRRLSASFGSLHTFSGVATDLFMDWFYESLEQHYDEFSFFSKSLDRKWLQDVQKLVKAGNIVDQRYHEGRVTHSWIMNDKGVPVAAYKPEVIAQTRNNRTSLKDRQTNCECLSSLLGNAMKLDGVVNRVIPVRFDAATRELIYDPCTYTGTVERLLGFKESQIQGGSPFGNLVRHACEFKKKSKKDSNVRTLPNGENYHILTQQNFKEMFSTKGEYRSADVQALADCMVIKPIDLYKIIVFWYLSEYADMHINNILFVPNFDTQRFEVTVIDAELTWNQNTSVMSQDPMIYQLHQGGMGLSLEEMQSILSINGNKLSSIFKAFGGALRDKKAEFDDRFSYLQKISTVGINLRKTMNLLRYRYGIERDRSDYEKYDKDRYIIPFSYILYEYINYPSWIYSIFDERELDKEEEYITGLGDSFPLRAQLSGMI